MHIYIHIKGDICLTLFRVPCVSSALRIACILRVNYIVIRYSVQTVSNETAKNTHSLINITSAISFLSSSERSGAILRRIGTLTERLFLVEITWSMQLSA